MQCASARLAEMGPTSVSRSPTSGDTTTPRRARAPVTASIATSLVDSVGQGAPLHGRMRYRYSSTGPNKEDVTRPQTPTPQHERGTRSQGCGKIFVGRIRRPIPVYAGY